MFLKYYLKLIYSEKTTIIWQNLQTFEKIWGFCQITVAFSEYMNFIVENYKTIPYGYVIDTCSKSHGNTISTFLISLWDYLWILFFGKIPKWHNFRISWLRITVSLLSTVHLGEIAISDGPLLVMLAWKTQLWEALIASLYDERSLVVGTVLRALLPFGDFFSWE